MKNFFTIPNIITLFRIALIPIFILLYFSNVENSYVYAFAVVALSALSDIVDGVIARKFNMVSDVGKVLDPIADKLTQVALAVCLCFNHKMLFPVLSVLFTKELLTAVAATIWLKSGRQPFSARWWGKVSTVLLYTSFMYYVLSDIFEFTVVTVDIIFTVLTIVFMLISMCGYLKTYISLTSNSQKARR